MPTKTRGQITAENLAVLNDSGTPLVSPALLRALIQDIADSYLTIAEAPTVVGGLVLGTTAGTAMEGNDARVVGAAPLNSPAFTGNPTAPTPNPGDNDTSIATTAFVQAALAASSSLLAAIGKTTDIASTTIPAIVQGFQTMVYTTSGDKGGARWRRVASLPSHAAKATSADGAYWEIADNVLTPYQLGAKGDGTTDDSTAVQNWATACGALGVEGFAPKGVYAIPSAQIELATGTVYRGDGEGTVFRRTGNANAILISMAACVGTTFRSCRLETGFTTATPYSDLHCGASSRGCVRCVWEDITVWGHFYIGINDRTGSGVAINRCRLLGQVNRPISINAYEIDMAGGTLGQATPAGLNNACVVSNNYISGVMVTTGSLTGAGSYNRSWTPGVISCNYGININDYSDRATYPNENNNVANVHVHHNVITSCNQQGIEIGGNCYGIIDNNSIDQITASAACGILVREVNRVAGQNVVVTSNRITSCYYGIYILGAVDPVGGTVKSEYYVICNGNQVASSISHGIFLTECQYIQVVNNMSRSNGGSGLYILANSSQSVIFIIVSANMLVNNTGYGLIANASADRIARGTNLCFGNTAGNVSFSATNSTLDGADLTV